MPQMFADWPIWALFVVLFALAMLRGQAIYWLARYLTSAGLRNAPERGWRGRFAAWLDGSGVHRGADVLRRLGLVAVPLCYLTVGLQSAVLAAAGVIRIGAPRFTLAQIPGALAWATIYSTIGWALWEAAIMTVAGSPWGIGALVGLAACVVATVVGRRRRAARHDASAGRSSTVPEGPRRPGRRRD